MLEYLKQTIGGLECIFAADPAATGAPDAVLILCHGFGAPGTDLVSLGDELLERMRTQFDPDLDLRFIFPAAPVELDPMFESRAWWMIDIEKIQQMMAAGEVREMRTSSPPELPVCREKINEVIEYAKSEFDIPASRIIVGGFSQGAMLSTDVALHSEDPLGGLIVWSGSLICENEWTAAAQRQDSLTVAQSHGTVDPILPFAGAKFLQEMLGAHGHSVEFVAFNGQHAIPMPAIDVAMQLIEKVVSRNRSNS